MERTLPDGSPDGPPERLWWSRLRWRMRGAWLWPAFAGLTVLDTVLLHLRPIAGTETGVVPAALLAGFFNVVAVALFSQIGGRLLRRRRPALPLVVARDYAGTVVLVAVAVAVAVAGQVHHSAIVADQRDFAVQRLAVHDYVVTHAPAEYRRRLAQADTWELGPRLYRTCVPAPDPRRALCVIVNTGQSPPGVTLDPNRAPNSRLLNPGGGR